MVYSGIVAFPCDFWKEGERKSGFFPGLLAKYFTRRVRYYIQHGRGTASI
jgi:hypothetical protein